MLARWLVVLWLVPCSCVYVYLAACVVFLCPQIKIKKCDELGLFWWNER